MLGWRSTEDEIKRTVFIDEAGNLFLVSLIILSINFLKSVNIHMLYSIILVIELTDFNCDRVILHMNHFLQRDPQLF
jgi:hypothetical protein